MKRSLSRIGFALTTAALLASCAGAGSLSAPGGATLTPLAPAAATRHVASVPIPTPTPVPTATPTPVPTATPAPSPSPGCATDRGHRHDGDKHGESRDRHASDRDGGDHGDRDCDNGHHGDHSEHDD